MGLLTFAGRITLVVTNIVFMLFSLTLIIGAFILRFANDVVQPYASDVLDKVENSVQKINVTTGFSTDNFELGPMVSTLCTVIILVGVVLLAYAFVGCCGACCNLTTLMLVYAIVLIVLLIVQLVLIIITYGAEDVFLDRVATGMKTSLSDYIGLNGTTADTLVWNWVMQEFDCCGAESYADFANLSSYTESSDLLTPIACCNSLPLNLTQITDCAGSRSVSTDIKLLKSVNNYDTGCAEAVWSWMMDSPYFITVVVFCLALQVVLIIFACLGYKNRGVKGGLV